MNKSLNIIGSVSKSGYGVVTYNLLKYMIEDGWDVSLFPKHHKGDLAELLRLSQRNSEEERYVISRAVKKSETFDYDAPCLTVWHQFDLCNSIGRGIDIAYPFFELDTFKPIEKHHLGYVDELVVSSKWAKEVVENNGIKTSTHVIPPGVDLNVFNYHAINKVKSNNNTIFLNCGKWEVRKGHDFLFSAFNSAFTKDDNVELWMLPTNPFLTKSESSNWESMYMNSEMGRAGKIRIAPWFNDHKEVANIMGQADCGIFPSRAEGWNLELLEMMALGKPVIATNYSAHTEFCTNDNSLLIDIDNVESAYDGKWFFDQGNWAEIGEKQMEQTVSHMKQIHGQVQAGENVFNQEGIETASRLSWEKCVKGLASLMTEGIMYECEENTESHNPIYIVTKNER